MLTRDDFEAAVAAYWDARQDQLTASAIAGAVGAGTAGSVRGGRHFAAISQLIAGFFLGAGYPPDTIRTGLSECLELPGYYRPQKQWDLVVAHGDTLVAAFELKSLGGPSYGNNFNNRIEEASAAPSISAKPEWHEPIQARSPGSVTSFSCRTQLPPAARSGSPTVSSRWIRSGRNGVPTSNGSPCSASASWPRACTTRCVTWCPPPSIRPRESRSRHWTGSTSLPPSAPGSRIWRSSAFPVAQPEPEAAA